MQCPRCQYEHSPKANFCEGCGTPLARPDQSSPPAASYADLQREVDRFARTLSESLEQQTATSEILQVISSSPTDVQPTFDSIATNARRLCEAAHAMVFRFDGQLIHLAAHDNLGPERLAAIQGVFPIPPSQRSVTARAILTRTLVHVRDRQDDPELTYGALNENFPNTLSVPLLAERRPARSDYGHAR
jgi:two-component system NtrC family sensor kinase